MRDRHFPRLCRTCDAPMARQEDTGWKSGAAWDQRRATRKLLRVIGSRAAERTESGHQPLIAAGITIRARVAQAQHDVDRWADEGGRVAAEPSARTATSITALS
jgi:hypothetical protein